MRKELEGIAFGIRDHFKDKSAKNKLEVAQPSRKIFLEVN